MVRSNHAFDLLANIVASDRLMVFTGSGISSGLLDRSGRPLPDWKSLLLDIAESIGLSEDDYCDVHSLLRGDPNGQEMIEAASILEHRDESLFTELLKERLTPKALEAQPADVQTEQQRRHDALLNLRPRGIMTLNIDCGHEIALERRGELGAWTRINPLHEKSEREIRGWLADRQRPLLFEAHGSLAAPEAGFVFSHRAYRDLLYRNPAYRALLRHLLSEFSFLFVGFGLTDLDFDQFLHEHAMDFGEPLRQHVVIRKGGRRDRDVRQATRYRRRFGIHILNVKDHAEVWERIRRSTDHVGSDLRETLALCLGAAPEGRKRGHLRLQALGPAGRGIATRRLIEEFRRPRNVARATEAINSLGHLRYEAGETTRGDAKEALLGEIEHPLDTERLAHALTAVEDLLDLEDLGRIERASAKLRSSELKIPRGFPDPDGRNPVYLEAMILRLRARHRTVASGGPSPPKPRADGS